LALPPQPAVLRRPHADRGRPPPARRPRRACSESTGNRPMNWPMNRVAPLPVLPVLGGLILVLGIVSLAVGKVWVPPWHIFSGENATRTFIILDLRLPRTLLAILVGGVLGLAGAVMQGYLRNPLADPGVLGVSACAAFGAVMAIWFGIAGAAVWVLPLCAMAAAIAGTALLYALAVEANRVTTFILAGIILNSLAGA